MKPTIDSLQRLGGLDMLNLGADWPDDEYDSVADLASSVLVRGGSVARAVDAVVHEFHANWDISLDAADRERVREVLAAMVDEQD